MTAEALWCTAPGMVELRAGAVGDGVLVKTLFSGISRDPERLVIEGKVPGSKYDRMRRQCQEGAFPIPANM